VTEAVGDDQGRSRPRNERDDQAGEDEGGVELERHVPPHFTGTDVHIAPALQQMKAVASR
jgi:hypothetical protein